jgi:hypothetical protein
MAGSFDLAGWRDSLVGVGFGDDGERLRGQVEWTHPTEGRVTAYIEVEPDETFPFAPPQVRLLDAGVSLEPTFHIDRPGDSQRRGNLCLWDDSWAVDEAPWRDPRALIARTADWLENTAAGWPDDDVCDLERYLEPDPDTFVLYNADHVLPLVRKAVRTVASDVPGVRWVTSDVRNVFGRKPRGRPRRRDHRLAYVDDLGQINKPLRDWEDIRERLRVRAEKLQRNISLGLVDLLILIYQRGHRSSVLAVHARTGPSGIILTACESADTSATTREIRVGAVAADLVDAKIAVVGCGAIGSFAADVLYRSGVRDLSLYDSERLRPGNVVRHLAPDGYVGARKVEAVRACLAARGLDIGKVQAIPFNVRTLKMAIDVLRQHHVVVDATGSSRTTSLLASAAEAIGPGTGHSVVSACVQREGDIVRVDRMPLRHDERHLAALPAIDIEDLLHERGCGSPISRTPAGAVIAAADLASRIVIDEATGACSMPATLVDVRRPQPESPFDRLGLHTSALSIPSTAA